MNDIYSGAELQAPMYTHSLYSVSGNNTISLKASELSFIDHENEACYRIGAQTRLISLWGMQVTGGTVASSQSCYREDFVCVGSSSGSPGCLPAGSRTAIAITNFSVPAGHNGVILFMAKTRFQADANDQGGNALLWINVDGVDVGTVGVQQINDPNGESSRTATASYLAAGSNRLSAGGHTVTVYASANGYFLHLAATKDLPLIFLD